ncbi:MAG: dTDP-4-dehydrorhamnose 3,5-epimerase family protein [Chloroflexota bacterium]
MEILKTELEGVLLIHLSPFEDFRGHFVELYNRQAFIDDVWQRQPYDMHNPIPMEFVEDDISVSRKNVLRGIHADSKAWKLITCLHGVLYVVVVNCDKSSEFGKHQAFTLTGDVQILVPPKHGIGHLVLSDMAVLHYKQSEYYLPERQTAYRFDNPRFGIRWPIRNPILSRRDEFRWLET